MLFFLFLVLLYVSRAECCVGGSGENPSENSWIGWFIFGVAVICGIGLAIGLVGIFYCVGCCICEGDGVTERMAIRERCCCARSERRNDDFGHNAEIEHEVETVSPRATTVGTAPIGAEIKVGKMKRLWRKLKRMERKNIRGGNYHSVWRHAIRSHECLPPPASPRCGDGRFSEGSNGF